MSVSTVTIPFQANGLSPGYFILLFSSIANHRQYAHTNFQFRQRKAGEQLISKLGRRRINSRDDPMRSLPQVNSFTTTIVRRAFARDPAPFFQAMKQRDQRGFFDPEPRGDFRLGQGIGGQRQVQQRAPFRLSKTHRLESRIELQTPGPSRPVEKRAKCLGIKVRHNR